MTPPRRTTSLASFVAVNARRCCALASLTAVAALGCADPRGDYDDWLDYTEGKRGVVDAGPIDSTPLDVEDTGPGIPDVSGTFIVSCLPTLAGGEAKLSILFYGELKVTGENVDVVLSPLLETATKMSKSQTVGTPLSALASPVTGERNFVAKFGNGTVPGNSQRIGDSNLVFTNFTLQSKIQSKDRLCAELQGELTAPFPQDFNGPGDGCVFVRLEDGADLPTATSGDGKTTWVGFTAAEHACP